MRVRVSAGECYVCCIAVHPLLHPKKTFLALQQLSNFSRFLFSETINDTKSLDLDFCENLQNILSGPLPNRPDTKKMHSTRLATQNPFELTIFQFLPRKAAWIAFVVKPVKTSGNAGWQAGVADAFRGRCIHSCQIKIIFKFALGTRAVCVFGVGSFDLCPAAFTNKLLAFLRTIAIQYFVSLSTSPKTSVQMHIEYPKNSIFGLRILRASASCQLFAASSSLMLLVISLFFFFIADLFELTNERLRPPLGPCN